MTEAAIYRRSEQDEYYFHEGCHILELLNSGDDAECSIARARVEPGRTTRWHSLSGITERYLIVQGSGLVEIADYPPQPVVANDVVVIPAGARQRITATGSDDLVFMAICTPRFTEAAYVDREDQ